VKERRGLCERGQATIEFAIVLPLVLLLIAGLIEFGKGFNYWLNLNHLASEGARWVAVDKVPAHGVAPANQNPTINTLRTYLVDQITTKELQNGVKWDIGGTPAQQTDNVYNNISVCFTPTDDPDDPPRVGDEVRVRINTKYTLPIVGSVANFANSLFGGGPSSFGNLTLNGSATVRLEQPPSIDPLYAKPCT
jgi:Flp pilus assembly protein TadG